MLTEIIEGIRMALGALRANPLRSGLTTLGVVIGITVMVITGWLVQGFDDVMRQLVNLMGTDVVYVDRFDWSGKTHWRESLNRKRISRQQTDELISRLTVAKAAVPMINTFGSSLYYGDKELSGINIYGTLSENASISVPSIKEGRFHSPVEDRFGTYVLTIGFNIAKEFFPDENPIGKVVTLRNRRFEVIGVLDQQSALFSTFIDNQVYMPLATFESLYGARRSKTIAIKAGSKEALEEVRIETRGLMRSIRNLRPNEKDDFAINEVEMFGDMLDSLRNNLFAIGFGVTFISFLVGIIGITNIMFVSVTERTREIGIRKAIGAKRRTIMFQFLVESATLCFSGALIALLFCSAIILAGVNFVEYLAEMKPYIPPQMLFIASLVSLVVGLFAGLIPAFIASRLDPVESLRYE